ncbi:MAG: nuclear transport factor 2 family protein [Thermoplasmata archaeon]|nr:nuclear transport factor 2 family protein [Thermoplasmata archaeon]
MTVEENLQLADAFVEACNVHDWTRLTQLLSESAVLHDPILPEPIHGSEGIVGMLEAGAQRFPSGHVKVVHRFGQDDQVCVETIEGGTDPDSGKVYRIEGCWILRVLGGKVSEVRFYYDAYGLLLQVSGFPVIATEDSEPA